MFDFHNTTNLRKWYEESDNERHNGHSSASLELFKTRTKKLLIFYSFLQPMSNGECFSGVRTKRKFDLRGYKYLSFDCKAYGNATTYKIILTHGSLHIKKTTFVQNFEVCL